MSPDGFSNFRLRYQRSTEIHGIPPLEATGGCKFRSAKIMGQEKVGDSANHKSRTIQQTK